MKKCPQCGLLNPEDAALCDCLHAFQFARKGERGHSGAVGESARARWDGILAQASNPVGAAVTLVLAWLMVSDGNIAQEEIEHLRRIAGAIKLGEKVDDIVEIAFEGDHTVLLGVCQILRTNLDDEGKTRLVELVLEMALVDGYFTTSEGHIVRFLADFAAITPLKLGQMFRKITGRDMPNPGDPSSVAWWRSRERRSQPGHENRQKSEESRRHRGDFANRREWALGVLGLESGATPEQIKTAYRRLAQLHHPDKFSRLGPEAVEAANTIFKKINEAYGVLAGA